MKTVREALALFGGIVFVIGFLAVAVFAGPSIKLMLTKTFGVAQTSAETDVYRQTKSYVEGTIRDLREMQVEYIKAEDDHKDALRSLILHRAGEIDREDLPLDLQSFLDDLEYAR